MPGTALDHPLVRQYLRDLDVALKVLPTHSASELREQLTAHLAEVLRPEADDEAVAQTLDRLGLPWSLAAEAAATSGRRPWIARLGWRAWTLITAAVVAIGAVTAYVAVIASTGPLTASGLDRSTTSSPPMAALTCSSGCPRLTPTPLGAWRSLRYTLPVSIPPNQTRYLRMLWTSTGCLQQEQQAGVTIVALRVRVGLMTREEDLQLPEGFFLGPAARPCA